MNRTLRRVGLLAALALQSPAFVVDVRCAEPAAVSEAVTFNKHIAPLVFANCSTCHRPGEVAPFSLLNFNDVKKRSRQIVQVTSQRLMPPWKSVEGHGKFLGERRLTKEQIALFDRWVQEGAVAGDPADLPAMPQFSNDWTLGKPDLVISMDQPYAIPADGPDIYRNFAMKLDVPPGKFIKALEFRPSNRRVVHHALFATDVTLNSRKQDEADPLPGFPGSLNIPGRLFPGSLSAWTPGREPRPLPEGISMPWKTGWDMVLQLHLHPSGKPEEEQSTIGIYLTDEPPQRSTVDIMMLDRKIDIPPGDAAFKSRDEFSVPVDCHVLALFPHMHLIGRDFKLTAYPPAGDSYSLIWINDWDFNWQSLYQCDPPLRLAAGTKVVLEAVHDNSEDNVRNPNQPPKRITFGEQTTDEMTAALVQLVPASEDDLPQLIAANQRRVISGITAPDAAAKMEAKAKAAAAARAPTAKRVMEQFDKDKNGKLDFDELSAATGQNKGTLKFLAMIFDKDADETLDLDELTAALEKMQPKQPPQPKPANPAPDGRGD